VPEYDAFGREIGDDPLTALREATVQPAPVAEAEEEPAPPVEAPPPEREFEFVRPPRRQRGFVFAIVGLAVFVAGLASVVGFIGAKVEGGLEDAVIGPSEPAPAGLEGDSLIRRANFGKALNVMRDSGLGRPAMLRVAADRIDATLLGEGNRMHVVQVRPDLSLRELSAQDASPSVALQYKQIDPAAPERLTRAGAKRAGVQPRTIDYLVLTAGDARTWGAYFKGGAIVQGDTRGRPRRVL
jgi:hypothetical protein